VYKLKISKFYDEDVDSCYDYINDTLQNPKAADDLILNVMEKLNKISENPKIRPLVRDEYLASLGYRLITVKNYMIFYIIDEEDKHLKIVRFLYGKRDWINILKEKTIEEMM
jgi:toxin ParE1/3/4